MNPYLAKTGRLPTCCQNERLCEHRLTQAVSADPVDGILIKALGEIADDRKLRFQTSTSRRQTLALAGALGLGALAPLTGRANAAAGGETSAALPAVPQGRIHVLESNAQTVRVGAMDPHAPIAVTVESGDVVHYPHTWVNWGNEAKYGMRFDERESIRRRYPAGPYSLVGPVAVRGAEPGDWIECRMLRLKPIEWGWNSSPIGVGALPTEFQSPFLQYYKFDETRTQAHFNEAITIPLMPTQGVIATMPDGDRPVSGILSGKYGGNIVLRELTEGCAIFLSVQRSGGLIWTGDSHAAQGDGVVNQTAIETAMEDMRIQFILHKRAPLSALIAETPTHWIGIGHGDSLENALTVSLRSMMDWLSRTAGISREQAYSLFSIAGSFRITQYAHQTGSVYTALPSKGVHGMLPKSIFSASLRDTISTATRTGA